eukprot:TRINITY_DN3091_c0_g1_i10.p1 TRINITY_DN3091_c0_g1~~TRINITY_DN3091_c0_g1_i10.p1  ORF type:complete len:159 (+),score=4.76 TRINITY_DN3091_c0_g1_i10:485-961(+)
MGQTCRETYRRTHWQKEEAEGKISVEEADEYYAKLLLQNKDSVDFTELVQNGKALRSVMINSEMCMSRADYLSVFMREWQTHILFKKEQIIKHTTSRDNAVMTLDELAMLLENIDCTMTKPNILQLYIKVPYGNEIRVWKCVICGIRIRWMLAFFVIC